MKKVILSIVALAVCGATFSQNWPAALPEAKPYTRWWWLGSAVDTANLNYNLSEYARAGIGGVEITPIYGVIGNDANDINYLSPHWMEMLRYVEDTNNRLGLETDMNNGTGWPFGGPNVSIADAATKAIFQDYTLEKGKKLNYNIIPDDPKQQKVAYLDKLMAYNDKGDVIDLTDKVKDGILDWEATSDCHLVALFIGKTLQKVKRAAPGGEGLVMDHFSHQAVADYFKAFDKAFSQNGTPFPHTSFNDSYEVYDADWTPELLNEFAKEHGYKLEDHFPDFLTDKQTDIHTRLVCDYRATLADMLRQNFTEQWTQWAHSHGMITRNQAHGSPGNLIDLYATVDIPECEGFGLSQFNIKGLRQDSLTRKNFSDYSMLKYSSSAAHITGKPFTSSETFTWLTEHFRTSLSQCKPDADFMFISGINHIFFHGTPYSPKNDEWPGWQFYASIDMSPTDNMWHDAPYFFKYITRCQSFLQMGKPDNDFLVYLPIYDIWKNVSGRYLAFDINKMSQRAPKFIETILKINDSGYDIDYISDRFIMNTEYKDGALVTVGGTKYKALIIPSTHLMPDNVIAKIKSLAQAGAKIVFIDDYPDDVPGLGTLDTRRAHFKTTMVTFPIVKNFNKTQVTPMGKGEIITGSDYRQALKACNVMPEEMKTTFGLHAIRRTDNTGYHYFISSLQAKGLDSWVPLGVHATSAALFDPMTGNSGKAQLKNENGQTEVYLQLHSGESVILQTYTDRNIDIPAWKYVQEQDKHYPLEHGWTLSFPKSAPAINGTFNIDITQSWTNLPVKEAKENMGTGKYSITFTLPNVKADDWILDLGDVRESARVRVNGQDAGCVWAVPYQLYIGKYLHSGKNTLEVDVTNLSANRISALDRAGVKWRKFKEINVVDLNYKKTSYANWAPMPSGLNSTVQLIPVNYMF